MTTEIIISIAALAFILIAIVALVWKGRKDANRIFDLDYDILKYFIKECEVNEMNEAKIILRLNELARMQGADREKLQVLNREFRFRFTGSLSDIVCHENTEQ